MMQPRRLVATSLGPSRHDVQFAAVRSWTSLGFDVFSMNTADEIGRLAGAYPSVRFVAAPRAVAIGPGRLAVHVYDVVRALAATDAEIIGVVNADIELVKTAAFPRDLSGWPGDGLVFGARTDVDVLGQRDGFVLPHGFDYFFFGRRAAKTVQDLGMCLGQPWWDYAVPFWALAAGLPVRRFARSVGFHVKHPCAWSWDQWQTLGRAFVRQVRGMDRVDPVVEHIAAMARETPWKLQEIGQEIVRVMLYRCEAIDPGPIV